MIDALIGGKLYGKPASKMAKSGRPFAVAKVRTAAGDGEGLFVSVIAFSDSACAALLALEDGDSVALAGSLTPKVWTDNAGNAKPAADLVAAKVLTPYHVTRKRRVMEPEQAKAPAEGQRAEKPRGMPDPDFPNDDLDF
jgi:single-stranded DNA-binding protein